MGMEIGKLILAFMVLINPFSALAIFLDLTRNNSTRERKKVAQIASLSVFIVIAVFAFSGNWILRLFGISTGAFQVGGGLLVFLIAISMMSAGSNPAKPEIGVEDSNEITVKPKHPTQSAASVAVVPLAIPMMIGPGGISTVVIYASAAKNLHDTLFIVAAGAIISIICFITLLAASKISNLLGETGLTILNRIMGMLLAAVSVEIVVAGLKALFPQLAG
ncbi:MarC family protein [Neisseria sp. 83E34]|uniref:MarC family protein n=1 Tax=Neisseria sp. 83E34 TaxID=1692264 RepID=UPI0006CE76FC|nr:MarC family protein [Neisseria sp. 83E34]KPN71338.1 membrane protein [Neisseria sp. 83E34]